MDSDGRDVGEEGVGEVTIGGGDVDELAASSKDEAESEANDEADDRSWRCKACGVRQRDPDSACHRCWNTTFVAGEGADGVSGSSGTIAGVSTDPVTTEDVNDVRVENVKATTARTTVAVVFGTGLFSVATLLFPESWLLHSLASTAEFGMAVLSVALISITGLLYLGAGVTDRE